MQIRTATMVDLTQIADVHIMCFPDSFSTQLGREILVRYYTEYFKVNPDLFLVGEENGKVIGFCMGYLCEDNNFAHNFLKSNKFRVGLRCLVLLLTGNKLIYAKIKKLFRTEEFKITNDEIAQIPLEKRGDLLSICLLPEYRGSSIAQNMIQEYETRVKGSGRVICQLTVYPDNKRAVRFYEKNGYQEMKKSDSAITYAKWL